MRPFWAALSVLAMAGGPVAALDYANVDRTIAKEPAYTSGTDFSKLQRAFANLIPGRPKSNTAAGPQYALMLFGPEAKVRVWVVLDGDTAYVDRDADGDLTDAGEKFASVYECKEFEVADPDGKTRYAVTSMSVHKDEERKTQHLMVNVTVKGPLQYRQYCDARFADTPKAAALAHFHGPLTAGPRTINWEVPPKTALEVGRNDADLYCVVGTMSARHGVWTVVRNDEGVDKYAFPKGVHPAVEVVFPPAKPGEPPVRQRYELAKFC